MKDKREVMHDMATGGEGDGRAGEARGTREQERRGEHVIVRGEGHKRASEEKAEV